MTAIEWTDATWNPVVGCSRVSKGCEHCYAERFVHRGMAPQHRGLTVLGAHGPRWTGEVRLVKERLGAPLRWRKPRRVFVNSLSDLFHDGLSNEAIAAVFGVMAACPHLTFQVLTKRPERMRAWFRWVDSDQPVLPVKRETDARRGTYRAPTVCVENAWTIGHPWVADRVLSADHCDDWPLPNVWLGVTAEDQWRADERIPMLLDTPAALRFVSYEPALGPVRFDRLTDEETGVWYDALSGRFGGNDGPPGTRLDWLIIGGESGHGARPFDLTWAQSAIRRARAAGVPVFFKQAGTRPVVTWTEDVLNTVDVRPLKLRDRKGGDLSELPLELHVREFPP